MLNSKGVCITDSEMLDGLKVKEEKMEKQRMKSEREEQKKVKHKGKERLKRFKERNMMKKG